MVKARFYGWLLLIIVYVLVAQLAKQIYVLPIFIFLLLLPLVSFVSLFLLRRLIKLDCQLITDFVERGEQAKWEVILENLHPTRTLLAGLEVDSSAVGSHQFLTRKFFLLASRSRQVLRMEIPADHCGLLKPANVKLYVNDIFGFFSLRVYNAPDTFPTVPVYPTQIFSNVDNSYNKLLLDGDLTRGRSRTQTDEIARYRELQPGDSLKLINWKLSARVKKHLVRVFDFAEDQSVQISFNLPDCSSAGPELSTNLQVRDDILDLITTNTAELLASGARTYLNYPGSKGNYVRFNHPSELNKLRRDLAMLPYQQSLTINEQLTEALKEDRKLHYFLLFKLDQELVEQLKLLRSRASGIHVDLYYHPQNFQESKKFINVLMQYGITVKVIRL